MDRIEEVNTSIAESVFAWFRGYAKSFNPMGPERHEFLVLHYCARHNDNVDHYGGAPPYLNKFIPKEKRKSGSYACNVAAKKSKGKTQNASQGGSKGVRGRGTAGSTPVRKPK